MVEFVPYEANPVFEGTGLDTWDKQIRERGYILFEDGIYKMWYSGYKGETDYTNFLGYATSNDGINWNRYSENPIFSEKFKERYYIFYHGSSNPDWADPASHALWTSNVAMSTDLIHWAKYTKNQLLKVIIQVP